MNPIYERRRVKVFAVIMILLLSSVALPQTRIRFGRGRTSAVVRGTVFGGSSHPYLLRAMAGQTMSVHLASRGDARFEIYAYRGQTLAENTTDWEGMLPVTNDYVINVSTTGRSASYTLEVTIR
ncbi:MAG TPA: hypothetical protein VK619_15700 [Pyrinomonadaceae bacterium]|nr:hypothetical protein [Pyrinomonadaceae bacterium]